MAFWPLRHANVCDIDNVMMRIQYFCKYQLTICTADDETTHLPHLFAFVKWYERHTHYNLFGASATVCTNSFETISLFLYSKYLLLVHIAKWKLVFLDMMILCPSTNETFFLTV